MDRVFTGVEQMLHNQCKVHGLPIFFLFWMIFQSEARQRHCGNLIIRNMTRKSLVQTFVQPISCIDFCIQKPGPSLTTSTSNLPRQS